LGKSPQWSDWAAFTGMLFDYRESIRGRGVFEAEGAIKGVIILLNLLFVGFLEKGKA